MTSLLDPWRGRRVLVTGHTGFIGGWLARCLAHAGARVSGFALAPPSQPSFFEAARLTGALADDVRGDIRDEAALSQAFAKAEPEFVFHLAAQPLVRPAWHHPTETIDVNVMGTVRVLDAIRRTPTVAGAVMMTTDKVYRNNEWVWPYRETDALGGHEPYSAGKAAAELIIHAYADSYFRGGCRMAIVRAGNVIGGGDWAVDRIVPDAVRAFAAAEALVLRNPGAIRPWQHVLDVVAGLLTVAAGVDRAEAPPLECWNIAPPVDEQVSVGELVEGLAAAWGGNAVWRVEGDGGPRESSLLRLDASKIRRDLGWRPRLDTRDAVRRSVAWYRAFHAAGDMAAVSVRDIEEVLS